MFAQTAREDQALDNLALPSTMPLNLIGVMLIKHESTDHSISAV